MSNWKSKKHRSGKVSHFKPQSSRDPDASAERANRMTQHNVTIGDYWLKELEQKKAEEQKRKAKEAEIRELVKRCCDKDPVVASVARTEFEKKYPDVYDQYVTEMTKNARARLELIEKTTKDKRRAEKEKEEAEAQKQANPPSWEEVHADKEQIKQELAERREEFATIDNVKDMDVFIRKLEADEQRWKNKQKQCKEFSQRAQYDNHLTYDLPKLLNNAKSVRESLALEEFAKSKTESSGGEEL